MAQYKQGLKQVLASQTSSIVKLEISKMVAVPVIMLPEVKYIPMTCLDNGSSQFDDQSAIAFIYGLKTNVVIRTIHILASLYQILAASALHINHYRLDAQYRTILSIFELAGEGGNYTHMMLMDRLHRKQAVPIVSSLAISSDFLSGTT